MEQRKQLRALVEAPEILVLPGAYDALSAKIMEQAGFNGVYFTGYGQSASCLGMPDVGLLTMTEMAARAARTAAALTVPLVCDGDTGFGNAVNVVRTVREYERAGAAAIQLEDQTFPKKCGHMTGRQVIPAEEMAEKIRAAAAARQDPDFLIIARTDARTTLGVEEAIRRARLYAEAGADLLFGSTFGGPFMSILIVFVPQVLVFSVLGTYIYRRTGNVYTGALTMAGMAAWIITGGSAIL